jgi:membrane associated rhomboid family serine protease
MIPLPIRDEIPSARFPAVTVAIIALNSVVWLFQLVHGLPESIYDFGAIPAWVMHHQRDGRLFIPGFGGALLHQEVPFPLTVLTSMFMHGGWLHIIGNMWFLWIFGDNVEDAMGPVRYAVFYLTCGLAAALAQIFATPASTTPMVGASGAIAGVLGAYALLYPRVRVRCLWILIIFVTFIDVPAWLLLGIWLASQFFIPGPGVAWVAHVGGFAVGAALVKLFARAPQRPAWDPGRWPRARTWQ